MRALFRTDASNEIGSGHVMRCLTLANALKEKKYECIFITKEHEGNLIELITSKGFTVVALKKSSNLISKTIKEVQKNSYFNWLNDTNENDARIVIEHIKLLGKFNFIFVDHYGINKKWEIALRPYANKIIVIDDLANREHDCNILIDQTLSRSANDYKNLVNKSCSILCGSKYAILRQEFITYRKLRVVKNKDHKKVKKVLIFLGGYDNSNLTEFILDEINEMNLFNKIELDVVVNKTSPYLKQLHNKAAHMNVNTEIFTSVENMAKLMSNNDICIGAAGTNAWERCCIGLPTIMFVLADNQKNVAKSIENAGAAYIVKDESYLDFKEKLLTLINNQNILECMGQAALNVTDGAGVSKILDRIIST
jgi:UDP-2,4-diacetamido-2,4,6-trideoxy-beta-L-altropyranose hydrolase